ncbi:hypothetical protein TARUN_7745 [Trichoderma arundinaceum]|uniref:Phthiocerol/phthiodiolone dimycocerosyl transferase C-terminal domain-containing protein n=1 Tax=Trichoderma arundinaceum TaxID=490622 RepID=A0A395NF93_TRIAR|nr:hypothetical protein TARUN_7745 [Trichoderma arundinaceum]
MEQMHHPRHHSQTDAHSFTSPHQATEALPTLNWQSSADGVSSRPLDTLENFFKLLSDSGSPVNREHWAVSLALQINFKAPLEDSIQYIRRAWLLTGRLHPTLTGSVVDGVDGSTNTSSPAKPILTIHPFDADAWLSKTFVVHHSESSIISDKDGSKDTATPATSASTLFAGMLSNGTPTCHWLPATQELFLRSAHWRIDGIGMLMLAHSFLAALASVLKNGLDRDLDSYDSLVGSRLLTRSLDDLADAYTDETSTPIHIQATADGLVNDFVRGVPSIGLPTSPGSETAAPGDSAREALRIDAATTAAIISACRTRNISVSSAVHAAIVRATATYPQHPLAISYATFFPVDMRRRLPKPYDGPDYAVGMFSAGLPICVLDALGDARGSGRKSYEEIARQLAAAYSQDLSRLATDDYGSPVSMLEVIAPYVRRTTKLFTTPLPPGLPQIQNPDMSSLGNVEAYIRHSYGSEDNGLEVADFWLGTQMLSRSVQCHVWGFRDELNIAGCFNVSFYEAEFVKEFLGKVELELLTGLGIDRSMRPVKRRRVSLERTNGV